MNLTSVDRPDTTTETKAYDEMNRVLTHVEPIRPGVSKTTSFRYWPSGMLKIFPDDNQQPTAFEYDPSDLRTRMTYPDNTDQVWGYDPAKNLTSRRTVDGNTQSFFYDGRNRQTNMRWDGAVNDWADFGYDDAGQLTNANNGSAAVTRKYDPAGRVLLERQNVLGLPEKDIQYRADGAGKTTGMGLVGTDYQFTYSYDTIGRFSQIVYAGTNPANNASDAWFQYAYDAASNETQRYCAMNGVAQIYDRDELGRIRTLTVQNATAPQYVVPAQAVTGAQPPVLPVQVPGLLAGLTNLMSSATRLTSPPVGTVQSAERYGYDPMNRLTSTYRDEDQYTDSFSYDSTGQLKGIDEILLRTDYVVLPKGQGYFYQQDHAGSVTNLMGFEGTKIESYRYDAFGAPTTTYTGGSFNNRFKFTGREYVPQFGIYEYRNRAFHPSLGRFMSEDPLGFAAGDSNLFRYAGNDPVDFTDPMGLTPGDNHPHPVEKGSEVTTERVTVTGREVRDNPGEWTIGGGFSFRLADMFDPRSGSDSLGGFPEFQGPEFGIGTGVSAPADPGMGTPLTVDGVILFSPDGTGPVMIPAGVSLSNNVVSAQLISLIPSAIVKAIVFYNLVHTNGAWDYKNRFGQYKNAGNVNYGYSGRAMGSRGKRCCVPPVFTKNLERRITASPMGIFTILT